MPNTTQPQNPTQSQKRFLSFFPILLTSLSLLLITILLKPTPIPTIDFPIFTLNTTSLAQTQDPTIPKYTTPNVYKIYLRTHCSGYYWNHTSSIVGLTCFSPSSPAMIFHHSTPFKDLELTTLFTTTYLPSLHAAFAFYTFSLIFLGASLVAGLLCMLVDMQFWTVGVQFWKFAFIFLAIGDLALLIACILTMVVQKQAIALVNRKIGEIGVLATHDEWYLGLSWLGFGFGGLGVGGWGLKLMSK